MSAAPVPDGTLGLVDPPIAVTGGAEHAAVARLALRRLTSGVTVLTVNEDGHRHGTTVSAAVTISREPLVLGACLRPSSSFAAMVRRTGLFSVNVLGAHQEAVARRFGDRNRPPGDAQFAGLGWVTDERTGAPLLAGSVAHLGCRMSGWVRVGDHDLLLGEVVDGAIGSGAPLLSFAGQLQTSTTTTKGQP